MLGVMLCLPALAFRGGEAVAQDAGPIAVDDATVEIVNGAVEIDVRNTTGVEVAVSAGIQGDAAVPLELEAPVSVSAGDALTISVDAGEVVPDSSTRLVLVVAPTTSHPDGWSTAVPFAIAAPIAAVPAVASIDVTARDFGDTRHVRVPLSNTGDCSDVLLPGTDETGAGLIVAGDHIARVTATCVERGAADDPIIAELVAHDLAFDGLDYAGTIDFAPDDPDAGDLELSVRRTMPFVLFLLLLGAGLVIAYLAHLWTNGVRTAVAQRLRTRHLIEGLRSTRPDAPLVQFAEICQRGNIAGNVAGWGIGDALTGELNGANDLLRPLSRWFRLPNPKDLADAGTAVDAVEAAVLALPDLANSLVRLGVVCGQLSALNSYSDAVLTATLNRPPDGLTTGTSELATIDDTARNGIRIAASWPAGLVNAIGDDMAWLGQVVPGDGPRADAFLEARRHAVDAWTAFEAEADGALSDDQIASARSHLYEARGKVAAARNALADTETALEGAIVVGAVAPEDHSLAPADVPAAAPAGASALLRARMWITDRLLFVLVVVAALVAGVEALYVDKAVGGAWDWLVIVTWGFVAATAAEPIAAAVERVANPSPTALAAPGAE